MTYYKVIVLKIYYEVIKMNCKEHSKYELSGDKHEKRRYESAMKHVEKAREAGKSSEEIHEIFKKVIEFDIKNIEKLAVDGPHGKYRSAVIHAQKALAAGKSSEEAHAMYKKIMSGETKEGHCRR